MSEERDPKSKLLAFVGVKEVSEELAEETLTPHEQRLLREALHTASETGVIEYRLASEEAVFMYKLVTAIKQAGTRPATIPVIIENIRM